MGSPASDDEELEEPTQVHVPQHLSEHLKVKATGESVKSDKHDKRPKSADAATRNVDNIDSTQNNSTQDIQNQYPLSNQERRSSLPPGLLESGEINSLCGQMLRYMGDEQYSMACGRHLRCMGDQLCYNYFIRNVIRSSGEFQHQNQNSHALTNSHSTPNLSKH
ncbi:unnamed protein product [Mytilus coruscus]|uniref:Uncharacterized protein n=1 Tax=Mytilus coruscus TaxID=42192 RepID=A0A6J8D203_MYTCO|nr:unnamed protein product [Mytilus coruscus]